MSKKKRKSKGERLGWQRLEDVKPIVLTADMVRGVKAEPRELPPCDCGKCFRCEMYKCIENPNNDT